MRNKEKIKFVVYGTPAPAGSKKGFYNQKTKKVIITDSSKYSKPWQGKVLDAALEAVGHEKKPFFPTQPLSLILLFYIKRPKGHYGTGKNTDLIKESAPDYPIVKPDVLKLARAVEDALSGVIYRDDSQIVIETISKDYGEPERVEIICKPL